MSVVTTYHLTLDTNVFSSITVRLAPDADAFQGILQYRNNNTLKSKWKNLCSDKWDIRSADVVCRQLGMGYALREETVQRINQLLQVHFDCTGNEVSLNHCENVEVRCQRRNKAVSIKCSGQNGQSAIGSYVCIYATNKFTVPSHTVYIPNNIVYTHTHIQHTYTHIHMHAQMHSHSHGFKQVMYFL